MITGEAIRTDLSAEVIALIISCFFLVGILYITRLILNVKRTEDALKKANDELESNVEALKQANARFQTLIHAMPDIVYFKDAKGRYVVINKAFEKSLGLNQTEIIGKTDEQLFPPGIAEGCRKSDEDVIRSSKIVYLEDEIDKDNEIRFFDTAKVPLYDDHNKSCVGLVGITRDITKHKRIEGDLNNVVVELKDALAKVKQLSGLLPICASCKKIKDDKGYWKPLEFYISEHSEAEFSHGVCPECAKKLYPEHYK
jgi:PAS domain S-box-containing protein